MPSCSIRSPSSCRHYAGEMVRSSALDPVLTARSSCSQGLSVGNTFLRTGQILPSVSGRPALACLPQELHLVLRMSPPRLALGRVHLDLGERQ